MTDLFWVIFAGFLWLIGSASIGIMDLVSFHWHKAPKWMKRRKQFWDPQVSWKNKWKEGSTTEERFKFSSTILVSLTDGWHLAKSLMLNSYVAAISIVSMMYLDWSFLAGCGIFIVFKMLYGLGFYTMYR